MNATVPKERLRGQNLAVFMPFARGLPMEDALYRADSQGLVLASVSRIYSAIVNNEGQHGILDGLPCWSGTMVACVEPGKKLGRSIEHVDQNSSMRYVFPVPEEHWGKEDVVLVAEHPDFTLEAQGRTIVVRAAKVGIVENFARNGEFWYAADNEYRMPAGGRMLPGTTGRPENPGATIFLRRAGRYVGLVTCGHDYARNGDLRYIYMLPGAWSGHGVIVEVDERPILRIDRQSEGVVSVFGSREQIDAATRLLGQLGGSIVFQLDKE